MLLDVSPGDTLHSDDYVELLVAANTRAYIYAVQWFPNGNLAVLFPNGGDVAFEPDVFTRIPSAPNDWFQLDNVVGTETIYIIASKAPISRIDDALGNEIRAIRDTGVAAAPAFGSAPPARNSHAAGSDGASPPPPRSAQPGRMLTMANRGLRKVTDLDSRFVVHTVAPLADDKVVVASFSFHHAR